MNKQVIIALVLLFSRSVWAQQIRPGDHNSDSDVDLRDFQALQRCFSGEAVAEGDCLAAFDPDRDGDVDADDYSYLHCTVRGPLVTVQAVTLGPVFSPTNEMEITVEGEVLGWPEIEVSVGSTSTVVAASDCAFSVEISLEENQLNRIFLRGRMPDGSLSATTLAEIVQDSQPPDIFIDFPESGAEITTEMTDVAGRVSDVLSGFMGLSVTVNGQGADVDVGIGSNGTFLAEGIQLNPPGQPTLIQATAVDELGNTRTKSITVHQIEIPVGTPQMVVVSGNGQIGEIESVVEPIVLKMTRGDGSPFVNKLVTVEVKRSNGRLFDHFPASEESGSLNLQVRTDANGEAKVYWRLGTDAGCGNNRLTARSTSVAGTVAICASATPKPPRQINIGSGNNQIGETNSPLAEPLRVWVSDSCNGIGNVPVTFNVVTGGGKVNAQDTVTVNTGNTGHAQVMYTLGQFVGNQIVEANFPANSGQPAVFVAFGQQRDQAQPTSFSGLVVDNASKPVADADCELRVGAAPPLTTVTDSNGQFQFDDIGLSGPAHFVVDGSMSTNGSFPSLAYEIVIIPNAENSLPVPVLLPALNTANEVPYSTTEDVELSIEGIEGLRMIVRGGSMRLDPQHDGIFVPAPDGTVLSLNQVHHDDIPMPMPDGAAPPFAWTLQPAGAHFDPPIEIIYPNMSGLPAGSIAYFLSFNHDTGRFEIVASGHVSDDGATIETDPGAGLSVAGWGCNCPPYSVIGSCQNCEPTVQNGCGSEEPLQVFEWPIPFYLPDTLLVPDVWPLPCTLPNVPTLLPVTPVCNRHDRCYQECGASQTMCDDEFLFLLQLACDVHCEDNCIPSLNCKAACYSLAYIYWYAVHTSGADSFCAAQHELFERGCCRNDCSHSLVQSGPVLPPFDDEDADFLPTDWEIDVGLDPDSPDDAIIDFDGDGLVNHLEFLGRTDPFLADTDGDGESDLVELGSIQSAPQVRLDDSWTVSVSQAIGRTGINGQLFLTNIPAPDLFGAGGPGTVPDFISDDFVRLVATTTEGETTYYAFSDPFQISSGQTYVIEEITISDMPPPLPESIAFTESVATLTLLGESFQPTVLADLGDGEAPVNVTPRISWTVYRTSNLNVADVNGDGLVTATGAGMAFITAVNDGATSVMQINVSPGDPLTTVEGLVEFEDGTPVEMALVEIQGLGNSAETDATGFFTMSDVATEFGPLTLVIRLQAEGESLGAAVFGVETMPGAITDVGVIELTSLGIDTDEDCIPDDIENTIPGLDPKNPDSDGDEVLDGDEDFDEDGLTNCQEIIAMTDLVVSDTDSDGLDDLDELIMGTDPRNRDTDDDQFADGDEASVSSDPLDGTSTPLTAARVTLFAQPQLTATRLEGKGVGSGFAMGKAQAVSGTSATLLQVCDPTIMMQPPVHLVNPQGGTVMIVPPLLISTPEGNPLMAQPPVNIEIEGPPDP